MQLYSYAVIITADPDAEEYVEGEIVIPPTPWKLYPSSTAAQMDAIRSIPPEYMKYVDRLEVAVRPF